MTCYDMLWHNVGLRIICVELLLPFSRYTFNGPEVTDFQPDGSELHEGSGTVTAAAVKALYDQFCTLSFTSTKTKICVYCIFPSSRLDTNILDAFWPQKDISTVSLDSSFFQQCRRNMNDKLVTTVICCALCFKPPQRAKGRATRIRLVAGVKAFRIPSAFMPTVQRVTLLSIQQTVWLFLQVYRIKGLYNIYIYNNNMHNIAKSLSYWYYICLMFYNVRGMFNM